MGVVMDIVHLARLRFLVSGPIAYFMGVAATGAIVNPFVSLSSIIFVWLCHVNSHFVNDYFDFEADKANKVKSGWSGGSRVLVDGRLPRSVALVAGLLSTVSALAVALFALPAACLHFALTLIAVTWAYSAPPFSLQRRGFGELSITSVFAILVPALAATSHGHQYTLSMAASMAPIGLAMFARMLVMNLSDFDSDIATGKRTLAIRLGRLPSAAMYFGCQVLAMATCIALAVAGITPVHVPILFAAMTIKSVSRITRKLWQFGQNCHFPPELPRLASRASAHAMVSHLVGHVMAGHGISPLYAAPLLLYTAASGGL